MSFYFLVGHFQIDVTFLNTKLLRIFEVTIGYAEKHNHLLFGLKVLVLSI